MIKAGEQSIWNLAKSTKIRKKIQIGTTNDEHSNKPIYEIEKSLVLYLSSLCVKILKAFQVEMKLCFWGSGIFY